MRARGLVLPLALAAAALPHPAPAEAKPEFARRESKQCGFCHINPRGGGTRNETGLLYARSGFRFPAKAGDLSDFREGRERDAMARVRRLLDLQHIPKAIEQLTSLSRTAKSPAARKTVEDQLHLLDVKGSEVLGQARRLLRGKEESVAEGVELTVVVWSEYRGLSVQAEAAKDLKELRAQKPLAPLVAKEETEAKARLAYLDALLQRSEGDREKAQAAFRKVADTWPDTRAAKSARAEIG
jgi:hypothetical protein